MKQIVKQKTPALLIRLLYKVLNKNYTPAVGNVTVGDFNRLTPFSQNFGYDRGGPIDRYYIENFLYKERDNIKGKVLEIGDNEYTLKFGVIKGLQSEILHVDERVTNATYWGDLSDAPQIPSNSFDCIILTQTLHLIYDFKAAVNTCHRILKKGGVLLLTSPGITPLDHGEWRDIWYWSFTNKSLEKIIGEIFPSSNVEVETFGNAYVSAAFLYGMGLAEVSKEKLDFRDTHFQLIITVKAIKGGRREEE